MGLLQHKHNRWEMSKTKEDKTVVLGSIRCNTYAHVQRIVEVGLECGWDHAHKHTDTPDKNTIIEECFRYIMNGFAEEFYFEECGED